MPPTYRKPLGRSILLVCLAFVVLLCLILSVVNYATYKRGLKNRYEAHIRDILYFTHSQIDTDDLAECIRTGVKSPKYLALQQFIDSFKDSADIHYLYVIKPLNEEPVDNVMDIIAAMSTYEKENMPEMAVTLNGLTGSGYSVESVRKYLDAAKKRSVSFFTAPWVKDGVTYTDFTGTMPLFTSKDEYIGLLCVDVDVTEIKGAIMDSTMLNIILILILGAAFIVLFIIWSHYNITKPIQKLENSVTAFAYQHKDKDDIEAIAIENPNIHTDNEVESLANAVVKMSKDMRNYAENVIEAENKARMLREIANKDALTNVRNKACYDTFVEDMNRKIETGETKFAVVMVDLNNLKSINDNYGHENGNIYIKKGCSIICHIFAHSPVFRIGGDEFVAIFEGDDYENRDKFLSEAHGVFKNLSENTDMEPWHRVSAAIGSAIFNVGIDKTFNDVFNRADKLMYNNKAEMKGLRND